MIKKVDFNSFTIHIGHMTNCDPLVKIFLFWGNGRAKLLTHISYKLILIFSDLQVSPWHLLTFMKSSVNKWYCYIFWKVIMSDQSEIFFCHPSNLPLKSIIQDITNNSILNIKSNIKEHFWRYIRNNIKTRISTKFKIIIIFFFKHVDRTNMMYHLTMIAMLETFGYGVLSDDLHQACFLSETILWTGPTLLLAMKSAMKLSM